MINARRLAISCLMLFGVGGCAHAASVTATPDTAQQIISSARSGDRITLAPGDYPGIVIKSQNWDPPVVVDATAARFGPIVAIDGVSGLTWRGGTFDGGNTVPYAFIGKASHRLVIDGLHISRYVRNGIGLGTVTDVRIVNNKFTDMGSDGIDLAQSQRAVIDNNSCSAFVVVPKAHPDCIQLWSRNGNIVADITITNNTAIGDMQGISMFNHVRNGVDDGGFDRITVNNNHIKVMQWNGIAMTSCRDCSARDNRVDTLLRPDNPRVKAWLKVTGKSSVVTCNNIVSAYSDKPSACKTETGN